MSSIGSELRRLREDCLFTLKEVSEEVDVSTDFLSKVEKGDRNPSIELIQRLSSFYELPQLIDFYYEVELSKLLTHHPNPKKLLRKVLKDWGEPITLKGSSPVVGKAGSVVTDLRRYVKGGRNGKVKGYDFYQNERGNLTPKERKYLLKDSQNWMMGGELDGSLTDIEIVDEWNRFYDENGFTIPKFKEKWEREFLPSKEEMKKDRKSSVDEVDESDTNQIREKIKNQFWKPSPDVSDLG